MTNAGVIGHLETDLVTGGAIMSYKEVATTLESLIQSQSLKAAEALRIAAVLCRERAAIEEMQTMLKKGDPIWYANPEEGCIEEGEIFDVHYKDGIIESLSVDFKKSGDFDEFYAKALGENLFANREMAENALRSNVTPT